MSISSISNAVTTIQNSPSTSTGGGSRALWIQVGRDLNSGNLAGAQKAFSSLKSLYEENHTGTLSGGPLASDITSLGKALKSGSLSAAQSAFSTLEQAAEAAGVVGNSAGSSSGTSAVPSTTNRVNVLA